MKIYFYVAFIARYMYEFVVGSIHPTWINIINSFLVLYNDWKRPASVVGQILVSNQS